MCAAGCDLCVACILLYVACALLGCNCVLYWCLLYVACVVLGCNCVLHVAPLAQPLPLQRSAAPLSALSRHTSAIVRAALRTRRCHVALSQCNLSPACCLPRGTSCIPEGARLSDGEHAREVRPAVPHGKEYGQPDERGDRELLLRRLRHQRKHDQRQRRPSFRDVTPRAATRQLVAMAPVPDMASPAAHRHDAAMATAATAEDRPRSNRPIALSRSCSSVAKCARARTHGFRCTLQTLQRVPDVGDVHVVVRLQIKPTRIAPSALLGMLQRIQRTATHCVHRNDRHGTARSGERCKCAQNCARRCNATGRPAWPS